METLRLIAWRGYGAILKDFRGLLASLDLSVEVEEYDNADLIYRSFINSREYYDAVIVDWEYRHHYQPVVSILPAKALAFSRYLDPFKPRYFSEIGHDLCFVPLRFGTNGIVIRTELADRLGPSPDLQSALASSGRLGIWDWWLPNMLLLCREAGLRTLEELSLADLETVKKGALREFAARFANIRGSDRHTFSRLADIIAHELARGHASAVDCIVGPSEMVVAPIARAQGERGVRTSMTWRIPKCGGLVWLETVALSDRIRSRAPKFEAGLRLLEFLQSEEVQAAFICGGPIAAAHGMISSHDTYWAYALNNTAGIDRVPIHIRRAFGNPALEKSALEFGKWVGDALKSHRLMMRTLPPEYTAWRDCWTTAMAAFR